LIILVTCFASFIEHRCKLDLNKTKIMSTEDVQVSVNGHPWRLSRNMFT